MKKGNSRLGLKLGNIASSRRSQLQISFGMLFSIILIIAFIAVAIYAITIFLNTKNCTQLGIYKEDLQGEIDRAFQNEESGFDFQGIVPSSVDYVCFVDTSSLIKGSYLDKYDERYILEEENFFFAPLKDSCKDMRAFKIEHINIEKITSINNPYCAGKVDGQVSLRIVKGFNEDSVCIGEECS